MKSNLTVRWNPCRRAPGGAVIAAIGLTGLACASAPGAAPRTPPEPGAVTAAVAGAPAAGAAATAAVAAPAGVVGAQAEAKAATAEQKLDAKAAEEQRRLQEDRAKAAADHQAQLARFTPELRAQARELAEKRYGSGHAAIAAALASPHRAPGNADRDRYRHPLQTLDFFGLRPSWSVLEYEPGGGWYTELLAPALARSGKLYVTSGDPGGPESERSTLYAQRLKLYLESVPELFGKVQTLVVAPAPATPTLPPSVEAKLDLVLVIRELHNIVNSGQLPAWLAAFHQALKPHGVLGIVEHRAQVGVDPLVSSKKGYLPEAWVIAQIEAAGFRLSAKSEINANPKDTKDYPEGVWTLPPTYRLGAKDHDKYAAIGESDRMTLRFVRK